MRKLTQKAWFDNCGAWPPHHDLSKVKAGIAAGLLNVQDELGMTALSLAAATGWQAGVEALLSAGTDTELRYYRTGETALYMAVTNRNEAIVKSLIAGGANPDAANYWGVTPRRWHPEWFEHLPKREDDIPEPRIQNAEHLADHYHPRFKVPDRQEREGLQPGQAVDLYVYGPKTEGKADTVKARISARIGLDSDVRYRAIVETPIEQTHLGPGTTEVEFGPENVASVYVPRPTKTKKAHKWAASSEGTQAPQLLAFAPSGLD
jgi:hypothetical protein